ncbi:bifunctional phosphopantothenoylcysteine decarboxylase/phosphopantothenate--cysteine ligase CoaBC [Sphingobacteriales bacterium UPWRP_1]|nr:phosphopantothenoylcysteine decarboxylase [Sphingobacteriales bacterium TSM_CSS]PSJ79026.1 bifunctional phosphopantothenoylcysteine decarboxylase/phosphopantothenate--cysteine ligase CoaBC [Sphingobacteriales bacterium UPWRP_1]
MSVLLGKKILLGVCGSIAAYKAALLTRLLVKNGAEVRVIMTQSAAGFVTPLTFSTLSKHETLTSFYNETGQLWNNHVELGLWADAMLIAPATANTLAKMANGLCDNLLTATYLSARCPVFIAPAMDLDMWQHASTQRNLAWLTQQAGTTLIPVGDGELASGLWGKGRMAEPEAILQCLEDFWSANNAAPSVLKGKNILITAGPTHEPIDPVRFIGNRSSGKMGLALVNAALQKGANVWLVLGPVSAELPQHPNFHVMPVQTANEMFQATVQLFENADVAILAAAVSDYTPEKPSDTKIKKTGQTLTLHLQKTRDILAHLGNLKRQGQILVGFALETDNELKNAQNKLHKKNLDFIVLNSMRDAGAGFQHGTNKITIIDNTDFTENFPLKNKTEVAKDILNKVENILTNQ